MKTKDGVSAYVFAIQTGLPEIAELLRQAGAEGELSLEDEFVAACAKADRSEATRILAAHPDMFNRLSEAQLRQLPNSQKQELTTMQSALWSSLDGRSRLAAVIGARPR